MGKKIIVIGAGVIGLTVALQLKRANSNYDITILGHHLPGDKSIDYTSPIAGANWHSFALRHEVELQKIDQVGYDEFMKLSKDPALSVWEIDNVNYFTKDYTDERIPWFEKSVENYVNLTDLPEGVTSGFKFKGVVISVPFYLNYLVFKNSEIGNTIKRVPKIKDVKELKKLTNCDYIINCSGILVNELQGFKDDKKNFPIRGQVIHVTNSIKQTVSVEGFDNDELLYIFPRKEGGSIIGGCFQNSSNPEEDDKLTESILARAKKYAPELFQGENPSEFDIIAVNVGLRPFRETGPRIEIDGDSPWLIHAYGAGGGGYQGSYGFSKKVLKLLQSSSKL